MSEVEIRAFVFTDIVGSTRLKKRMPGRDNAQRNSHFAAQILKPHRERIEHGLTDHGGRLISVQGDGHFLEFRSPIYAVMWAIDVQKSHQADPIETPGDSTLGVKIGIHMGPATVDPNDQGNYIGTSVDYAARLVELASEGRVYVSEVVATFVREEEIAGLRVHDHGVRNLYGIGDKLVFEILYGDLSAESGQRVNRGSTSDPLGSDLRVGSSSGSGPSEAVTVYEPAVGLRIKDYELLEEIGEGGMGKVFRARHMSMGRTCVLKLIKDTLLRPGNEEIVDRFYQEIQIVAKLKHPNIIQAYDSSNRNDPHHFLVMEYIPGTTLDQMIQQRGTLSLGEACEITRQSACGLQCIYEHGLVHRDIKPSNLMIADETDGEVVKILDLGLALLVDDNTGRITQHRQRAIGTVYYMAPEQWVSTSVDVRADIYSLGCTFYHMIVGRPPFQDSKFSQEHAHRFVEIVEPESAELPGALWAVMQKMLHKKLEHRFATPQEVVDAIDEFMESSTVGIGARRARPLPPRPGSATPPDGTEKTVLDAKPRMPSWFFSRRTGVAAILLALFAAVLIAATMFVGSDQQRVIESSTHRAAAEHFVLTLPGMNGGWWFDEIPWFFPQMRMHLLNRLTVEEFQDLQALARQTDVDAFYERLQQLCQESFQFKEDGLPAVSDPFIRLFGELKDARPFDEVVDKPAESPWGKADALLAQASGTELEAVGSHLRALLQWKMRIDTADDSFETARDQYHSVSKELKALCIADRAVTMQRLRRWREAGKGYVSARQTLPDPSLAAPLAIFTYAMEAEVKLFDASKPRNEIPQLFIQARDQRFRSALDQDHPLRALLLSREALYYLETWQLAAAGQKGEEAVRLFQGHRANLYFRSRQFKAMAYHFLGKPDEAQIEFDGLLKFIDELLASDNYADQEKPTWRRLKPNLLGRLADSQLFGKGDAAAAAATLDLAAQEAVRFAGGPKAAYLARIQFKRSIAKSLAGDAVAATAAHENALEVAESVVRKEQRSVFKVYQDVATAFLNSDDHSQDLVGVINKTAAADDQGRPSRDDLQLLLFVCEYLLAPTDMLDPTERKHVVSQKEKLSAPLVGDGKNYLRLIAEAARSLAKPSVDRVEEPNG